MKHRNRLRGRKKVELSALTPGRSPTRRMAQRGPASQASHWTGGRTRIHGYKAGSSATPLARGLWCCSAFSPVRRSEEMGPEMGPPSQISVQEPSARTRDARAAVWMAPAEQGWAFGRPKKGPFWNFGRLVL